MASLNFFIMHLFVCLSLEWEFDLVVWWPWDMLCYPLPPFVLGTWPMRYSLGILIVLCHTFYYQWQQHSGMLHGGPPGQSAW